MSRATAWISSTITVSTVRNARRPLALVTKRYSDSGVVMTKLDGTAKGGVILSVVEQHRVPVRFIGLGERVEDLHDFDPAEFVEALLDDGPEAAPPQA